MLPIGWNKVQNIKNANKERNNIMVSVSSQMAEITATNVAMQIDADILAKSTLPPPEE